jgi:hypothetical protein
MADQQTWAIVCMQRLLFITLFAVAGCGCVQSGGRSQARSAQQSPVVNISAQGQRAGRGWLDYRSNPALYLHQMKALIRAHAQLLYGHECGTVTIPDSAFFPIEITAGGGPELAVSFGRAQCGPTHDSLWRGSGGEVVQFWRGEDQRPALLLEQQIDAFAPAGDRLETIQNGGYCGSYGTNLCRVIYRWDAMGNRLETAERKFTVELPHGVPEYGTNCLLGTGSCPGSKRPGK